MAVAMMVGAMSPDIELNYNYCKLVLGLLTTNTGNLLPTHARSLYYYYYYYYYYHHHQQHHREIAVR